MSPAIQIAAVRTAAEAARFIVDQDGEDRWVAVEIHGRAGGLFRSREAAIGYAADETGRRPAPVRAGPGSSSGARRR